MYALGSRQKGERHCVNTAHHHHTHNNKASVCLVDGDVSTRNSLSRLMWNKLNSGAPYAFVFFRFEQNSFQMHEVMVELGKCNAHSYSGSGPINTGLLLQFKRALAS